MHFTNPDLLGHQATDTLLDQHLLPADYVVEQCRQDLVASVQRGHSKNGH